MSVFTGGDYRRGSLHALATAVLLAMQEPFSAPAARHFSSAQFVCLTQIALLLSVPLLTLPAPSRRDFIALLSNVRNLGKFAVLFAIGVCGLILYNFGLAGAHPIITAAVLNLSPFWAALVALVVSKRRVGVSPLFFSVCFVAGFVGATMVAWSQINASNQEVVSDFVSNFSHYHWIYAIPIPIFFALSGALVGRWFGDFDESATIAANFVVAAVILIPASLVMIAERSDWSNQLALDSQELSAALLLILGTLAASAAGRVYYQIALTATKHDNGFVTMFFLLIPVLSSLIGLPLSRWNSDLRILVGPMFIGGLGLVIAPLFLFLLISWRKMP